MPTQRTAHLVEICFATQARRFWNGSYELVTSDGRHWFGQRKLGSIEGLEDEGSLQLTTLKVVLSGVDDRLLAVALGPRSEYIGRALSVYHQDFTDEHQISGAPRSLASGLIDGIEVSRVMAGDASRRTITVTAPNIFYGRSRGSEDYYTDLSQKQRFRGDRGLQYRSDLYDTNIPFPW